MENNKNIIERLEAAIAKRLQKIDSIFSTKKFEDETKEETEVVVLPATVKVGDDAKVVAEDGTEMVLPDGEYSTENGKKVSVIGGLIAEITEPSTETEMEEEKEEEASKEEEKKDDSLEEFKAFVNNKFEEIDNALEAVKQALKEGDNGEVIDIVKDVIEEVNTIKEAVESTPNEFSKTAFSIQVEDDAKAKLKGFRAALNKLK